METHDLHFVVEDRIPFIKGLLEPYGKVTYLYGPEFRAEAVRDADAVLVRTRDKCDARLLDGSRCTLVATGTIGTDHIDKPWCEAHGIEVANAAGCNAPAVAQYVLSSILHIANRPVSQYTIGIVGVGHVGSIVEKWARQLDMQVMLCDPPRQQAEGGEGWSTLDEIAEKADIITFHTPLDASTRHLADADFFARLRRAPIIINAARGPVVDNLELIKALDSGRVHHAVIDTWEGEPDLNRELLGKCVIATPHIAGYSLEGKMRATRMLLDAVSRHFGLPHIAMEHEVAAGAAEKVNAMAIMKSYNPFADTAMLKAAPDNFEEMRDSYNLRHEVAAGKID